MTEAPPPRLYSRFGLDDVVKLLLCKSCTDIFRLRYKKLKTCICGESKGVYMSWTDAIYSGNCLPIGFNNKSFVDACYEKGGDFTAFVINQDSESFIKVDDVEVEMKEAV
ncbi:MAG: hypothetical protein ACXABY_05865 [Candidatus Thorarchaeota archaeon]